VTNQSKKQVEQTREWVDELMKVLSRMPKFEEREPKEKENGN
jgi:hypothetical protein